MLGSEATVRHPIRGVTWVGAPPTLEPGPYRISSPMQLQVLSNRASQDLHLSGGTGWLIEAILVRLGGIHRGSSSAATVDGARRGSRGALGSRRPGNRGRVVAVGSRHWLK
jgi:hypothetical protein